MNAQALPDDQDEPLRPIPRPVTLRQSVYDALVNLVVAGGLSPGQHLAETQLARRLGVSRHPVREALHLLQAEGWIELRPNGGAFVRVPSDQEVDELLNVRELLEAEMARLAARRAGPDQVARLRRICDEGGEAVKDGDTERFVTANNDFHTALAELSANTVLARLTTVVARRARWHYHLVAPRRVHDACQEHIEIAEAIAARDQQQAMKAARAHIERTRMAYRHPG